MHSIGQMLDSTFLRSLLNGISIPLEVQCAILDERGRVAMLADVPSVPACLPFDITKPMIQAAALSGPALAQWRYGWNGVLKEARTTLQPCSARYDVKGLRLFQCVAPIIVDRRLIGFVASGRIPVGDTKPLRSFAALLTGADNGIASELAIALHAVGCLPEDRIVHRTAMVAESAQVLSRAAAERIATARDIAPRASLERAAIEAIVQAINEKDKEDDIFEVIIGEGFRLAKADRGNIDIWDESKRQLVIRAERKPSGTPTLYGVGHSYDATEGISGYVFRTRRSARVGDVTTQNPWRSIYQMIWPDTRSELAVPLISRDRPLGVINLESSRLGAFSSEDQSLLELLAKHVVIAINKARLLESKESALAAFARSTAQLGTHGALRPILTHMLEQSILAVDGDKGEIMLYDEHKSALLSAAVAPASEQSSALSTGFRKKKGRNTPEMRSFARGQIIRASGAVGRRSEAICVPMLLQQAPLGVLRIDKASPLGFSKDQEQVLLQLARHAALAAETAWHGNIISKLGRLLQSAINSPLGETPSKQQERTLTKLATLVFSVMKPKACSVMVLDQSQGMLRIPPGCEHGIKRRTPFRLSWGQGLAGMAVRDATIQESIDVTSDLNYADTGLARRNGLVSCLSMPIFRERKAIGALNYYTGFQRDFRSFERDALHTVCAIAGMVLSATEIERDRRARILDEIGTGVTLIGIPPNWDIVRRRLEENDLDWNLNLHMPLLFMNKAHKRFFPDAQVGERCYRTFNRKQQSRPCWWCPTIRAMLTGKPHTSITHSPGLSRNWIAHYRVTASILQEEGKPVAAIESTTLVTRELEAAFFARRLINAGDEGDALRLAAECLGRGTQSECILVLDKNDNASTMLLRYIFCASRAVAARKRYSNCEWTDGTPIELPPSDDYFDKREPLFYEQRCKRRQSVLGGDCGMLLRSALSQIGDEDCAAALSTETIGKLLPPGRFLRQITRAIAIRIGRRDMGLGYLLLLGGDARPDGASQEDAELRWCRLIAEQLATRLDGLRLARRTEVLAQFSDAVIERAPVGVVITDATGKITRTNEAWRAMSARDPLGENIFQIKGVKAGRLRPRLRAALRGHAFEVTEYTFETVSGKQLVISAKCVALYDENARVTGLLITCWDMTDVARRKQELMNQTEAVVLGSLAAGAVHEILTPAIAVKDGIEQLTRHLVEFVKAERRLSGLVAPRKEREALSGVAEKIFRARPVTRREITAEARIGSTLKHYHIQADDRTIQLLARLTRPARLTVVLRHIDRAASEDVSKYLACAASVAELSHSVRIGITAIIEVAKALKTQSFLAPDERHVVDISDTIHAALVVLKTTLDRADIRVATTYSTSVPAILCIPGRLSQMWRNVIDNCIDATMKLSAGRRRIWVSARKKQGGVLVTIAHNGAPLPSGAKPSSIGRELPPIGKGTHGYGMWIVRQVVAEHGGSVALANRRGGKGVSVRILLPIRCKRLRSAHQETQSCQTSVL